MKYKVIFDGVYGDMRTFADIVEASSELEAVLLADGAEYVFDETVWDYYTGELTSNAPKTMEEARIMARDHDRTIDVTRIG